LAVCRKTEHELDSADETASDDWVLLGDYTQDLATRDSLPTWPRLYLQVCIGILQKHNTASIASSVCLIKTQFHLPLWSCSVL